ncbi:hypothetical protein FQN50_003002 [Emmonsiellopsis sp. PD_5]|nr:hypothetical protein FQN50_003002 [Emmonsiellopsis sp. PD_5]
MSPPHQQSGLDRLPFEIFNEILSYSDFPTVKCLSLVNKLSRLRCLSVVFRSVHCSFSRDGLDGLRLISSSEDIRQHVVSVTYNVMDILDPRVVDFDKFHAQLYSRHSHSEEDTEHYYYSQLCMDGFPEYESHGGKDGFPEYESVYEVYKPIGDMQQAVLDENLDREIFLVAIPRFTNLAGFTLRYNTLEVERGYLHMLHWLRLKPGTSLERHLNVVASAIRQARSQSISVRTVEFAGNNDAGWKSADLFDSAESVHDIVADAEVLRLLRAGGVMDLIFWSDGLASLKDLQLCGLGLPRRALGSFLEAHSSTLRTIRIHKVTVLAEMGSERLSLTPDLLRRMLKSLDIQAVNELCMYHRRRKPSKAMGTKILLTKRA